MRKTKKSNIKKVVAAPAPACVCSRAHRAWSVVALLGLFLCGLMIGLPIGAKHAPVKTVETVTETTDYTREIDTDYILPCTRIERLMSRWLCDEKTGDDYRCFLNNADVYASMVEYGCPGNADLYRKRALTDLEIANALSNGGEYYQDSNVKNVIDTYKKLNMKKQANEFLDKVQKLTDPAIDFILQMEKIINE